nr:5-hydroxytryptamine receptor 3A-like [Misgurnus anguillicaudatus]
MICLNLPTDVIFVNLLFADDWYMQSLHIPGEWQLLNITINTEQYENQITYKITIKRRPLLYIINFIFPVFCFLVLDVASLFINASAGEKLSFKVTLLLSISVLLQILNDRLASTSSDIPLIGIYCCAIFILIGLSVLETILVNILIGKGEEIESAIPMETRGVVNGQDDGLRDSHNSIDTVTSGNEESTCTRDTGKRPSLCWTRAAKIIDVTFIVFYIITVIVLLSVLGKRWFLL